MGLLVSGIGVLVLGYSASYFDPSRHGGEPDLGRLAGLMVGFAGAMLGLVLANGLLTLFIFWELTSVTSFLLIGFDDRSAAARAAAVRALLVTGAGGLCLLAGLLMLGQQGGTTTISGLLSAPPSGSVTNAALVLVLLGAFTKSAQWPFNFWLPGAMAAPTPVSAYLHSATMVKAGIVVIARLAPAFAAAGPWRPMVVTAGVITMFVGGIAALRQQDVKLSLAHGTVSQLGLMTVLFGLGTPETTFAGVVMLSAHALFKAALFLVVGIVDHEAGTRDMRRLRGLTGRMPVVAGAAFLAAASMAAVPPTFGYVAKEAALDGLLNSRGGGWATFALVGVVGAAVLTVAYTGRLTWLTFRSSAPEVAGGPEPIDPARVGVPTVAFVAAPALLGILSLVFGLAAGPVGDWLAEVAGSLDRASAEASLALWHGFTAAFGLSMLVLVSGAALTVWVLRRESGRGPGDASGRTCLRAPLRRPARRRPSSHRRHPERLVARVPRHRLLLAARHHRGRPARRHRWSRRVAVVGFGPPGAGGGDHRPSRTDRRHGPATVHRGGATRGDRLRAGHRVPDPWCP